MAANILPDVEILRQYFDYDPEIGSIRYRRTGKLARYKNLKGYSVVYFGGRPYYAHRIAFKYYHGVEPPALIDHINRNKDDNRISNLRPATWSLSNLNKKLQSNNKSGVRGVHFSKYHNRYVAQYRCRSLGLFKTLNEAAEAYKNASYFSK
jgi:hypothetical protein